MDEERENNVYKSKVGLLPFTNSFLLSFRETARDLESDSKRLGAPPKVITILISMIWIVITCSFLGIIIVHRTSIILISKCGRIELNSVV